MTIQPINLRPLKAGEILDRAFRLYRTNFWRFIGIAGVLLGPLLVIDLLSLFIFNNTGIVGFIQSFLIIYLLYGALIWAVSHAYLGSPVTLSDSYRTAQRHFGSFLEATIRQGLAYIPVVLIAGVIFFASSIIGSRIGYGTGVWFLVNFSVLLLVVLYIFFFSLRWWFSFPAILLEDLDADKALKRSWFLTSQNFWHVAVVSIASSLLAYLVEALPSTLFFYLEQLFPVMDKIDPALTTVISQLGTIITLPLSLSILVIAYYDMRVRLEGYDLELALQSTPETLDITHESI